MQDVMQTAAQIWRKPKVLTPTEANTSTSVINSSKASILRTDEFREAKQWPLSRSSGTSGDLKATKRNG